MGKQLRLAPGRRETRELMLFNIVTLFPEFFQSPLATGILGRARESGLVRFRFINPRDFSEDKHRRVDDRPFGGGAGMLMEAEPLAAALESVGERGEILLLTPSGKTFDQSLARELAREKAVTLVCGRYEGFDARLEEAFPARSVSVFDAVLNGGETAALAIAEAVARLVPGFMGKDESAEEESFSSGLLEYPQYTRPAVWRGRPAPPVLLSGHRARIERFRRDQALLKTLRNRPELLAEAPLTQGDAAFLKGIPRRRLSGNLCFCLCHWPVFLEGHKTGASSLTNLDVHDIGRISRAYGMGPFFILTPLEEQLRILGRILERWQARPGALRDDRREALGMIRPVRDYAELAREAEEYYGRPPAYVATSANFPEKPGGAAPLSPREIRQICASGPAIVLLGTARGLDLKKLPADFCRMKPARFLDANHLPVRAAAAIVADRIIGDFN